MHGFFSQQDMRLSPHVVDGLWYCLCPSYRSSPSHRSIRLINRVRATSRRCPSSTFVTVSAKTPLGERCKHDVSRPNTSSSRDFRALQSLSIGDLETKLEQSISRELVDIFKIVAILKDLLQRHGVTPTTRHYKAYLLANLDREHGSAKNVESLLREMAQNGITADSATLHAALEVLAVHPDYLLRQEVIEALRARWLSLSPAGWHHVIAGLLREDQLELALDRLEQMERRGILLEKWLHSLLVYKLCDADEFSEALRLIQSRSNKAKSISSWMWLYLLRAAMRRSHHKTVDYVWKNAVDLGYRKLSVADCRDVLGFAAKHGNVVLAEAVFRHLSTLQTNLAAWDYEKLVQAYAGSSNVKSALEIVCQMRKHSFHINPESTRSILQSMDAVSSDPTLLWNDIRGLRRKRYDVPIMLANVILEHIGNLFLRGDLSKSRAIDMAIFIYKDIFDVCTDRVNTDTFNQLFHLCQQTARPDICSFLAKEMAALKVPPDQKTLETLTLICLNSGNRFSAEKYLADLKAMGWELSESAREQIRDKLS